MTKLRKNRLVVVSGEEWGRGCGKDVCYKRAIREFLLVLEL